MKSMWFPYVYKENNYNLISLMSKPLNCPSILNTRRFHTEVIITLVDMEYHLRDYVLILPSLSKISLYTALLLCRVLGHGHSCLFLCHSFKAYETTDHFILVLILLFRERETVSLSPPVIGNCF